MVVQAERDLSNVNSLQVRIIAIPAPTEADLASINARFPLQPLAADDIFCFGMGISSDATDSYYTRMDAVTTLENFVTDFRAGQALLDTHDQFSLSGLLGRSFDAQREIVATGQLEGQAATKRIVARWYMRRGVRTNEIISDILAGIINRSSVGFGGNDLWLRSDEDGKEIWDSAFYPGMKLPDGSYGGKKRATFTIVDGRAQEGSLVFKNSTPGADEPFLSGGRVAAVIARVQDLAQRNEIPRDEVARMAGAWGVRLAGVSPRWAGVGSGAGSGRDERPVDKEGDMSYADLVQVRVGKTFSTKTRTRLEEIAGKGGEIKDGLTELLADVVEEVDKEAKRVAVSAANETRAALVVALGELGVAVADGEDLTSKVRSLKTKLDEAAQYATDGRAYRSTLIDEAKTEGTRAYGNDFSWEATYEPMLKTLPVAAVRKMIADWRTIGDLKNPPGRKTREGGEGDEFDGQTRSNERVIDITAYRVG
jgi:hypothetical protein